MSCFDIERRVIEQQRELCAPYIEARTVAHDATLRCGNRYRARINLKVFCRAVAVQNCDSLRGNPYRSRNNEPQALARPAHLVIRACAAHAVRNTEGGKIECSIWRAIAGFLCFFARVAFLHLNPSRGLRLLAVFTETVDQQR